MSAKTFADISLMKTRRAPCQHIPYKSTTSVLTGSPTGNPKGYFHDNVPIVYDNQTMEYYKTVRQCHIDPILNMEVDENIAFKFKYQWDAYTGERKGIDPFGPLYFHPMSLIYYYYIHRLDGLWKDAVDTTEGYFQGYYDMLVGTGEELNVIGRDKYTELYLFRLPILDCYLTPEHNKAFITIGPKLTAEEIDEIENLSAKISDVYNTTFMKKCPSIKQMKQYYDSAIAKEINIPDAQRKHYPTPQYYYVDLLRQM